MNKSSLGYEQLDNNLEIEIFGIKFRINVTEDYFYKLKNLNVKTEDGDEVIEQLIDELIRKNAYNEIKGKYERDLGKKIDRFVWTKIIYFLYEELEKYVKFNTTKIRRTDNYKNQNNYRRNRRNYRRY